MSYGKKQTIVVIGGAQAGPVAAARAREFAENARIILLEKEAHVSWVQADLKNHLRGKVEHLDKLDRDRNSFFEQRYRIEVQTGTEAIALDNDSRRVVVRNAAGIDRIRYDSVIFAGGADTLTPQIKNLDGPGVTKFRNIDDLNGIRESLAAGAKSAVILGGGAYGMLATEGLRACGLQVTVIDSDSRLLPGLSLPAAQAALRALNETGVQTILNDKVVAAEPLNHRSRTLKLASGRTLDADLIVVCTGMRPRSQLVKEAGASLNRNGTIRVDRHMMTTLPGIYACGTAVSVPHTVTEGPVWLVQDSIQNRTAQIAGRSAAVGIDGAREAISPVAATTLHEVGSSWFARTGLSDAQARSALGDDRIILVTIHGWSAEVWLGGKSICIRLVVDKEKNRVVGGEVWGETPEVARRIDILAAAVIEGWAPARIADLDMAYSPGLGPAYDPVNAAGMVAEMTRTGEATGMAADTLALRIGRGDKIQLVDVGHSDPALQERHWPGHVRQMPLERLREGIKELDVATPVVLLSHTGRRAHLACRILAQRGFDDVYYLDGGYLTWQLTLDTAELTSANEQKEPKT
jgi:NADPH-dependent 2,4-dienoyl-CoA reductase/sulfur reductase-like enzyme/rhodanese-related sulfurtransferase